ncbi:MAG: hypothetical protein WCE82_09730 [Halobacteriota archaeon]
MATNVTGKRNVACWYGLHIGCLDTNDPNCTKCAERLFHAVNSVVRPPAQEWAQSVDTQERRRALLEA